MLIQHAPLSRMGWVRDVVTPFSSKESLHLSSEVIENVFFRAHSDG